jgi:hypothetical protein
MVEGVRSFSLGNYYFKHSKWSMSMKGTQYASPEMEEQLQSIIRITPSELR